MAAWTLAFTLVAYLALRSGGYDTVVHSEAAVAVWWLVLLGALAGILPARIGRAGWIAIALLAAFAVWTGLAIGWSESAERSALELGRVSAYLGVLVLAIALQGRTAARATIDGLACAFGLVTVVAVLAHMLPAVFPSHRYLQFLGVGVADPRKLTYPLGYWNALAAFAAMGAPLLLAVAVGARTRSGRAAAAATLPVSILCVYLTISRGGALALVVGLAAFLALTSRRLEAVATVGVAAAGSAVMIVALSLCGELQAGEATTRAQIEGLVMLVVLAAVGRSVARARVPVIALLQARRGRIATAARTVVTRRRLAGVAAVTVVALVLVAPRAWHDFATPAAGASPSNSAGSVFDRLQVASSNGRYDLWRIAVDAAETHPWRGIGPGTYELWRARHATTDGAVVNAYSLYLETLAEEGVVGLALLAALILWLLAIAVRRARREPPPVRPWTAAAAGGLAAFLTSAAVEWVWQMAALAMAAMIMGAVIVAGRDDAPHATVRGPAEAGSAPAARRHRQNGPWPGRVVLGALALAGLAAVLVPLAATIATRESASAAARGNLDAAFSLGRAAERLQPYAASGPRQQALALQQAGELEPAAAAARRAVAHEPTSSYNWLVLARIDAVRGATDPALRELRTAVRLDPFDVFTSRP